MASSGRLQHDVPIKIITSREEEGGGEKGREEGGLKEGTGGREKGG